MRTTTSRGSGNEREYQVTCVIDGLPFFTKKVDAQSSEEAAVVAFFIAIVAWVGRELISGPPAPPPVDAPPGAVQLPLQEG